MTTDKTAILLLNIGTPDSPQVKDVRNYLSEFLNDPKVMDIPWLMRKILVNLIIVPFRAPKSAKLYEQIWTEQGSPLLYYSESLRDKLNNTMQDNYKVFLSMRYGNPSIKNTISQIQDEGFTKIIAVPLFPQWASSSTLTAINAVQKEINHWQIKPKLKMVNQFYAHPRFIDAYVSQIKASRLEEYDHILFSYHGLPISHIQASHPENDCLSCDCFQAMPTCGEYCYKATCYATTRLLAKELGLTPNQYSQGFQSRLTKKWISPFTDEIIRTKANEGIKKMLVIAPAFVTDCLETIIEIGVEYKELFLHHGGTALDYVPSLNDSDKWVEALKVIIEE
jgi:protoporphyrin/coproporphyrin ferrochelatase